MQIRILSAADVATALPMPKAIGVMRLAFSQLSAGQALIFVLPMLFIERYVPSKLVMVILMYLFFFRKHRRDIPAKP